MSKRKVKFTDSEKTFIKTQIKEKIESLCAELNVKNPESELPGKVYKAYFAPKSSLINKLESDIDSYTAAEITNIQGAVERSMSPDCKNANFICFEKPLDWLNISDELKEKMDKCDFQTTILIKTGYYDESKKSFYLYSSVFRLLADMKEPEKVCLSMNGNSDVYKLGFLNKKKEILNVKPNENIDFRMLKFKNYHGSVKDIMSGFTICTSKEKAYELMSRIKMQNHPSTTIKFLIEILK